MKSKIVGILFIAVGALMLGGFILSMLMFFGDGVKGALLNGLVSLVFAIYALFLGSSLRARKKWAWYAGLTTLTIAMIGNIITLTISFSTFLLLPMILQIFSIYAIYADKDEFALETIIPPGDEMITDKTSNTDYPTPVQSLTDFNNQQQPPQNQI